MTAATCVETRENLPQFGGMYILLASTCSTNYFREYYPRSISSNSNEENLVAGARRANDIAIITASIIKVLNNLSKILLEWKKI